MKKIFLVTIAAIALGMLAACAAPAPQSTTAAPSATNAPAIAPTNGGSAPRETRPEETRAAETRAAEAAPTATASPRPTQTGTSTAVAPGAPADIRGIYVFTALEAPASSTAAQSYQNALNVPGVDGMLLVGLWSSLEPSMGSYDWSALDRWISYAGSKGKKITLDIRTGTGIPKWMFEPAPNGAGVKALDFTSTPHEGKTGKCDTETLAAPWDSVYLSRWDALLAALAAHLKSVVTYNAVTSLRITGINRTSDELRLPEETAQSTGLACVTDAVAMWQQAGYRPSKLLQAWDTITDSFQKKFPDKHFSVAIITNPPQVPFPPIAEDGSVIKSSLPDQNQPLLQLAAQKFSGRLVVQFNYLAPDQPANPFVVAAAQNLGTLAAFQTNNYYSLTDQGAACGGTVEKPTPCTSAAYLQMLENGIYPLGKSNKLRAQYLEIWHANVNSFPEDVKQAHDELLAQP